MSTMRSKSLPRVDDASTTEPLLPGQYDATLKRAKPSRWRRVMLVTGGVVGVLLIALIVVRSQMHRIASNAIASTRMSIQRMDLTHPRDDGLTLSVQLSVESPSLFPATIAPSNFTIVFNHSAVGVFEAPSMAVHHGHNAQFFKETHLRIADHTAWNEFAHELMVADSLAYEIHGNVDISVALLGGLIRLSAAGIAMNKTMQAEGMEGLRRMEITDIAMNTSTETQVLAKIKTCLYNPSTVTINPVGQICMEAHYETPGALSHVAHLVASNAVDINVTRDDPSHPYCAGLSTKDKPMAYGFNLLELDGEMLGVNQAAISALISKYLSNISAVMTVVPCSPRATTVDIFNEAMRGLVIPALLPPRQDPLVGRMFFRSITLGTPVQHHENEFIGLATDVTVEASSPLGPNSALQLKSIDMVVGLYDSDHSLLGNLSTRHVDIEHGRLVEVSNISVRCDAELAFEAKGKRFGAFVRESVEKKRVQLQLKGTLNVVAHGALGNLTLSGLPMDVVSELTGMDKIKRVAIEEFSLPGEAASPSGEVLATEISLWNPSLFAVSIGNVGLEMRLQKSDDRLGELRGLMNLNAGNNKLHFRGRIDPEIDSRGSVSSGVAAFFSRYLRGESSNVEVTVKTTEYPSCIWMTDALVGLKIETAFPGVQHGFQLISELEMRELDVAMRLVTANTSISNTEMRVRTDLTATLKMPTSIAIPLSIPNVSVSLSLQDSNKRPIGKLISSREPCIYKQLPSGFFRLNMTRSYPVAFPHTAAVTAMAGFVTDLLTTNGNVTMRISADTSSPDSGEGAFPDVETRMGILPLEGIPIAGAPELPAMNSFRDPPVKILDIDILEGTTDVMTMSMSFEISNPSAVKTALGKLVLDVSSSEARMGIAVVEDFKLECCGKKTILSGLFKFQPDKQDAAVAVKFLSDFVCGYFTDGNPQKITISGSERSTQLDVLRPALRGLRIPASLPTLGDLFPSTPTLVTSSMLYVPSILHLNQIPTSLRLRNPFSETITVTVVDLLLYPCEKQRKVNGSLVCDSYYSVPLARFAPDHFKPIVIPANSDGCYSCCQGSGCESKLPLCPQSPVGSCMSAGVEGFISAEAIAALYHTATTGLLMRVNGTIGAAIGAYETQLFYRQEALLVTMAT